MDPDSWSDPDPDTRRKMIRIPNICIVNTPKKMCYVYIIICPCFQYPSVLICKAVAPN